MDGKFWGDDINSLICIFLLTGQEMRICKTSKCHKLLFFQLIFVEFSLFSSKIVTLSSGIKLNRFWICPLKGKFPQTTMWIGWVESNFRNPTVKVWADLDNPFKRSDYAKLCMSPSLGGTLPEYAISLEDYSPLNLYIDFHNFLVFLGYQ